MYGADGWYGWQAEPWSVGALEVWYWSMHQTDRERVAANPWLDFLEGKNAGYPEAVLQREIESIPRKMATIRADRTRRTSASPTTCSTRTRQRPTRWCA